MLERDYRGIFLSAIEQVKDELRSEGKGADVDRWFGNLDYLRSEEKKIILTIPTSFHKEKLKNLGYITLLEAKLSELAEHPVSIIFEVENQPIKAHLDKTERKDTSPVIAQAHPQLRMDFCFETFVPDYSNPMAYNAAFAISKNPGKAYNPLLLYGGVGLGKTHLMQAIGNAIHQNSGSKNKIIYVTAETFTNDFTAAVRTQTTSKFKSKYRNVDVLLIDDIHFLQGKPGVQEELFYTFEALYNSYKQMVFTCDRPVSELKDITDRLKSRFTRGLQADLQMPKYETRRAILEKKLELMGKTIPTDVIDLIAQKVETNIRDLEASLTKLLAYVDLVNKDITVEVAQQQLRDTFRSSQSDNIRIETIQRVIADHYGISPSDLRGQKRTKSIVMPRHIALYIAGELTQASTPDLGREFGGRDHSTVIYSQEKIATALKTDSKLDAEIQLLIHQIKDYKN